MATQSVRQLISSLAGFTLTALSHEEEALTLAWQWQPGAGTLNPDIFLIVHQCKQCFYQPVRNGLFSVTAAHDLVALQLQMGGEARVENAVWKIAVAPVGMKETGLLHLHGSELMVLDSALDPLTDALVRRIKEAHSERI